MAELGFILSILLPILVFILLFWIFVRIFQWLWNITMPAIFPVPTITFWQAFRLLLIAGALFGGGSTVVREASNEITQLNRPTIQHVQSSALALEE